MQILFGSPSMSKTLNPAKDDFQLMHSLSSQDCSSDGQHAVCVDSKRNTEISQEKTEMLKVCIFSLNVVVKRLIKGYHYSCRQLKSLHTF